MSAELTPVRSRYLLSYCVLILKDVNKIDL